MKGADINDWRCLFTQFREAGAMTFCGWIVDHLRQGLKMLDNGEGGIPLRLENLRYTADGMRGEIYCRLDKRTYSVEIKPLTLLTKNEGAETLSKRQGD